ncbi:porin [Pseudochryseolinea flava]|uniref:Porin n=1 Tax=Pseudochryseolinea flava TaxID=2059302 RepID=A0A364Y3M6_9BACT|nr:porin [Pseudochryseolinea flava]RAW00944.1 porin [Pseudochryseolinea flava]
MNNTLRFYFLSTVLALITLSATAQEKKPAITTFVKKGKGVGFVTADSTFSLNFQFRMQNRAAFVSKSGTDLSDSTFEMRVRRLRFKFEGFVYNPKLTYYIQLSMSRGDMDWSGTDNAAINNSPNIVRDAIVYYSPTKHWRFGLGQTKLPGNRQRVVSSGDQQFADRSIVNATLNIDRDFGFFARYAASHFNLLGAVTSGEGRNSNRSNYNGLAYSGRVEILPFGKFTGTNDYQEGDLEREPKPKLSIAATYHLNDRAERVAGTLGNDTYGPVNLKSFETDILFKYNGWAFYGEYMMRGIQHDDTPITTDATGRNRFVYVGRGYLTQGSYLFKNNWEVAARWSKTTPFNSAYGSRDTNVIVEQSEFGVTKYLNGHRLKIQANVIYSNRTDIRTDDYVWDFWSGIFQVELGI